MNVLLSFSGNTSRQVAEGLCAWLPTVLRYVKPSASGLDVGPGAEPTNLVRDSRQGIAFSILCLTHQNIGSSWVVFEAGVLFNFLSQSRVVPFLFRVDTMELQGPLAQFRALKAEKEGTLALLNAIDATAERPMGQDRLRKLFERRWPSLDDRLKHIPVDEQREDVPATVATVASIEKITAALLRSFDRHEVVRETVHSLAKCLNAEAASLWLMEPSGRELKLAYGYGLSTPDAPLTYQLPESADKAEAIQGITAYVAVRQEAFLASSHEELVGHPSWIGKHDRLLYSGSRHECHSLYAIPLICEDKTKGVLKVENFCGGRGLSSADRTLCHVMGNIALLALTMGQRFDPEVVPSLAHLLVSPVGQMSMIIHNLRSAMEAIAPRHVSDTDRVHYYLSSLYTIVNQVAETSRALDFFTNQVSSFADDGPVQEVSLAKLVRQETEGFAQFLAKQKDVRFHLQTGEGEATLSMPASHSTALRLVLRNVLDNAIKYSERGKFVEVSIRRKHDNYVVAVTNLSPAVARDDVSRIFDLQYASRATRAERGMGFGLYLVKQMAERFTWPIEMSSAPSGVTRFQITLPAK